MSKLSVPNRPMGPLHLAGKPIGKAAGQPAQLSIWPVGMSSSVVPSSSGNGSAMLVLALEVNPEHGVMYHSNGGIRKVQLENRPIEFVSMGIPMSQVEGFVNAMILHRAKARSWQRAQGLTVPEDDSKAVLDLVRRALERNDLAETERLGLIEHLLDPRARELEAETVN